MEIIISRIGWTTDDEMSSNEKGNSKKNERRTWKVISTVKDEAIKRNQFV